MIDLEILREILSGIKTEHKNSLEASSVINEVWKEVLEYSEPEQKKGKWTATYSDCGGDVWVSWKCSNCGYVRKKGWKHTDDGKKPNALFCEICNADMRGEEE